MNSELSESDVTRIFSALTAEIQAHFGITAATALFRSAGLMPMGNKQYWQPLIGELSIQFQQLSLDAKRRTVRILAQQLMKDTRTDVILSVEGLLRDHGFRYLEGSFIPLAYFDLRETRFLPATSVMDVSTALTRLVDGDLDGALAAACGAVDSAATEVYKLYSLGDPTQDSFQQKVARAIKAKGSLANLEDQLVELGWSQTDSKQVCENMKGALNQIAYVMQSLRARMSDVHGHRPVLDSVVFDSLKLAAILISLLK